jgi:hypothetical protein
MIVHKGIYNKREIRMISIDKTDIGRMLCGMPVWGGQDILIHFSESDSEARRYANEVLIKGEKV